MLYEEAKNVLYAEERAEFFIRKFLIKLIKMK